MGSETPIVILMTLRRAHGQRRQAGAGLARASGRRSIPFGSGTLGRMSDEPAGGLVTDWMNLPDAAEALGIDITRVRQAVRDRHLLAVRIDGVLYVPAAFIQDGKILKGLPGLITVLDDSGYSDEESLRWMFSPDDSLPGTPVVALRENRGKEVRRRAQTLAW
jgi:hypothetical protein